MPDVTNQKKPWVKPQVRKVTLTDELYSHLMREAHGEARMPVKRAK